MGTTTKYMCLHLPENEHQIVSMLIEAWFKKNSKKAKIVYRPLIEGHIENHREVKITASRACLFKFMDWFDNTPTSHESFSSRVVTNPHRLEKANINAREDYAVKFVNDSCDT